jgi:endogenous inhibitor of DNA gyrase (YacG/DUF329 family)
VNKAPPSLECPSCQITIEWSDKYPERPFCSASCKNKDFIGWANEDQRIAGTPSYDDIFSDSDLGER